MAKIFVFRHTETLDNRNHIFSGHRDVPITEEGAKDAKKLANRLKSEKIHYAFCSPMIRTRQTLKIVLKYHPNVITCLDPRISERSYGLLQGKNKDKFAKLAYPLFKLFHRSLHFPVMGGESLSTVRKRTLPFAAEIEDLTLKTGRNIVICAHGNSIRGIREHFERLPPSQFNKIETRVGQLFVYTV
ncbi:histidine phosphatase family protein [Candidatus Dojkabacteria bacterium]|nr:histidine phosphatase family protein [Candidatus Dojkabacteria bacterium]